MDRGTFMDIVGIHYGDIKKLYASRDIKNDKHFDEDSFNDAFIKCAAHFKNETITYEDAIRYFWVAYTNTCKNTYSNAVELEESHYEDLTTEESDSAKLIYDDVMNAIAERYDEDDMMMYSLYKYHDWTKEELEDQGYDCTDLESRIKDIHKFAKQYCKNKYKSL